MAGNLPRVAVLGGSAEPLRRLLERAGIAAEVRETDGDIRLRPDIVVLLGGGERLPQGREEERRLHRFLRVLPTGRGMVVAYGREPLFRRSVRGFKYRFRWYDETRLWPGIGLTGAPLRQRLDATAAARVAHELGADREGIRAGLRALGEEAHA